MGEEVEVGGKTMSAGELDKIGFFIHMVGL